MPNLNGTGPLGQGPRTGRGMGRGWGCGGCCCGRGFGFGRFFSSKNDIAVLEEQEKMLVEELEAIREEKISLANEGK
jgi:hypothetical protein